MPCPLERVKPRKKNIESAITDTQVIADIRQPASDTELKLLIEYIMDVFKSEKGADSISYLDDP